MTRIAAVATLSLVEALVINAARPWRRNVTLIAPAYGVVSDVQPYRVFRLTEP